MSLKNAGVRLIYVDETSFNPVGIVNKVWQNPKSPLVIPTMGRRPKCVTLFGAISDSLPCLLFKLAPSTNRDDFVNFLEFIRRYINTSDGRSQTYLVLDNHRAHWNKPGNQVRQYIDKDFRESGHRFVLTFQPFYSCEFNAQETVWSQVKRVYRRKIAEINHDLTQKEFESIVVDSAQEVSFTPGLLRSNLNYLQR